MGLDKIQEGLFCIVQNMLQMKKHGVQNGELERAKNVFVAVGYDLQKSAIQRIQKRLLRIDRSFYRG